MIHHLEGKFESITPTLVVVNCGGVGYAVNISLSTYEKIKGNSSGKILTHLSIREDDHILYGFADENERNLFRHLITVNGIGPASARVMLSGMSPEELHTIIQNGNTPALKSIKGIGEKTAQRIILELQNKLQKESILPSVAIIERANDKRNSGEATEALVMLGFSRLSVEKAVTKIVQINPSLEVEQIIKQALKIL